MSKIRATTLVCGLFALAASAAQAAPVERMAAEIDAPVWEFAGLPAPAPRPLYWTGATLFETFQAATARGAAEPAYRPADAFAGVDGSGAPVAAPRLAAEFDGIGAAGAPRPARVFAPGFKRDEPSAALAWAADGAGVTGDLPTGRFDWERGAETRALFLLSDF